MPPDALLQKRKSHYFDGQQYTVTWRPGAQCSDVYARPGNGEDYVRFETLLHATHIASLGGIVSHGGLKPRTVVDSSILAGNDDPKKRVVEEGDAVLGDKSKYPRDIVWLAGVDSMAKSGRYGSICFRFPAAMLATTGFQFFLVEHIDYAKAESATRVLVTKDGGRYAGVFPPYDPSTKGFGWWRDDSTGANFGLTRIRRSSHTRWGDTVRNHVVEFLFDDTVPLTRAEALVFIPHSNCRAGDSCEEVRGRLRNLKANMDALESLSTDAASPMRRLFDTAAHHLLRTLWWSTRLVRILDRLVTEYGPLRAKLQLILDGHRFDIPPPAQNYDCQALWNDRMKGTNRKIREMPDSLFPAVAQLVAAVRTNFDDASAAIDTLGVALLDQCQGMTTVDIEYLLAALFFSFPKTSRRLNQVNALISGSMAAHLRAVLFLLKPGVAAAGSPQLQYEWNEAQQRLEHDSSSDSSTSDCSMSDGD